MLAGAALVSGAAAFFAAGFGAAMVAPWRGLANAAPATSVTVTAVSRNVFMVFFLEGISPHSRRFDASGFSRYAPSSATII